MAQRLTGAGEARRPVREIAETLLVADRDAAVGARIEAVLAPAAFRREECDDVVARLHQGDIGAYRLDHSRALVAEDARRVAGRIGAGSRVQIRVADAARDEADECLSCLRLGQVDFLDDEGLSELLEHGGADPHATPFVRLRTPIIARLPPAETRRTVRRSNRGVGAHARHEALDRCCGLLERLRRGGCSAVSTMTDDELAVALARSAVERTAPEEMVIFPAASEAFLEGQDPSAKTRGDPMLGFGVESAVVLLTPVALTVAKEVLGFLRVQLKKQADKHGEDAFDWLAAKLLRRDDDKKEQPAEVPELTDEQLEEVRRLAIEKAKQLKLADDKAELLADSLVGSLATA